MDVWVIAGIFAVGYCVGFAFAFIRFRAAIGAGEQRQEPLTREGD